MARVYVDANVISEGWFRVVADEIKTDQRVRFAYSRHAKSTAEAGRCKKLLEFLKAMTLLGRVDWVDGARTEQHISYLSKNGEWCEANGCDDGHLFATIYEKPTPYVFTMDMRIAKCRDRINRVVDARYCDFSVVGSLEIYTAHRAKIRA